MDQLSKKIYLGNNTGNYIIDFNIKKYIIEYIKKFNLISSKEINNLIDLHYIKNNNYIFIPHLDATKYYLLFIHHSNYYLSVLIDKNSFNLNDLNYNTLKIFHIRLRGKKTLYTGSLFEGSLIRIDNKSIFLINNIYILENKPVNENYLTKIKMIDNILNNIQTDKLFDTFELKVIRYYKMNEKDFSEFKNKMPSSKLPINGIEFININQNNSNYINIFPLKNIKSSSSILHYFKVKKINIPDVYELYCNGNINQDNEISNNADGNIRYGIAYISCIERSKNINKLFENTDYNIMECKYNKKYNKFEPIKISNEKISNYKTIIESIK
jgi:hypothetical protein